MSTPAQLPEQNILNQAFLASPDSDPLTQHDISVTATASGHGSITQINMGIMADKGNISASSNPDLTELACLVAISLTQQQHQNASN